MEPETPEQIDYVNLSYLRRQMGPAAFDDWYRKARGGTWSTFVASLGTWPEQWEQERGAFSEELDALIREAQTRR